MAYWRFLDYVSDEPMNHVQAWIDAQDEKVMAELQSAIDTLGAIENWDDPDLEEFSVFTEKPQHLGLAQLRFFVVQKQEGTGRQIKRNFRVIGLWRQEQREFVFLTGFEKSGRITIPANAFKLALDLRIQLEEGRGHCDDHV